MIQARLDAKNTYTYAWAHMLTYIYYLIVLFGPMSVLIVYYFEDFYLVTPIDLLFSKVPYLILHAYHRKSNFAFLE